MKTLNVLFIGAVAASGLAGVALVGSLFFGDQIEHGNVSFAVCPDGKRILFSAASGELYWFDLKSKQAKKLNATIRSGMSPEFSADGKTVAISCERKGDSGSSIYLIDSVNGKIRQLTHDRDVSDGSPSFSNDGKFVAFARAYRHRPYSMGGMVWDNYDLCIIQSDGKNLKRLTRNSYYQMNGTAFGTNGKVLFEADGHGEELASAIYVTSQSGNAVPTLLMPKPSKPMSIGAWASGLAMSRDGTKLTFISDRNEPFEYDLFVTSSDGLNPTPLHATKVSHYNQNPKFMPDGKSILFLAGTEKNFSSRPIFSLWSINLNGKTQRIAYSSLFTNPEKWNAKSKN